MHQLYLAKFATRNYKIYLTLTLTIGMVPSMDPAFFEERVGDIKIVS